MGTSVLRDLLSEEFDVSAGFLGTPTGLYRFLHRRQEVSAVREALRQGALTEGTIRRFAVSLLDDLHPGTRFSHELAISALAVALESRPTDFAEEFLRDLARLKIAEMSLSIRVARECRKHRMEMSRTKGRRFCHRKSSNGSNVRLGGGKSVGSLIRCPMRSRTKLECAG